MRNLAVISLTLSLSPFGGERGFVRGKLVVGGRVEVADVCMQTVRHLRHLAAREDLVEAFDGGRDRPS